MIVLAALLIILAIRAAVWLIGLALYHAFLGEPNLRHHPRFTVTSLFAIGAATLWLLAPFPWNFWTLLPIWWIAVRYYFEMPWLKALVLFLILTALTFLSRLAIAGALDTF